MTLSPDYATNELGVAGYAHGSIAPEFSTDAAKKSAWEHFARSWDDLPIDRFMADGGRYRRRRYAEFRCCPADTSADLLPHRAYAQSRTTNYLNGGVERMFAPFDAETARSDVLRTLLCWACAELWHLEGHPAWFAQVFQNRIICGPGVVGKPTPEGAHQDGVDYVLTVLVNRRQMAGGVSILYDGRDRSQLLELELAEPGEFVLNNDERILHEVTPITSTPTAAEGYRDVLVAIFTHMEDDKIPVTG